MVVTHCTLVPVPAYRVSLACGGAGRCGPRSGARRARMFDYRVDPLDPFDPPLARIQVDPGYVTASREDNEGHEHRSHVRSV